ncbi:MAG: TolB family protein, partial [Dehalococcoidia bacterium]
VLADGSRTTLLNNAIQPSLSADGKQIIYVDYPQNDFQTPSLAIANIDGSGPHKLLTDQKGFQGFFAPHLSPDGKCMAFAAVGGPLSAPSSSATPSINEEPPPALQTLQTVGAILRDGIDAPAALADGLIWQVWTACIDGSKLHALGNLREDYPYPLWSADGKSILFLGSGGLYLIGADGTNLKRLGDGVSHGEIAWYQK